MAGNALPPVVATLLANATQFKAQMSEAQATFAQMAARVDAETARIQTEIDATLAREAEAAKAAGVQFDEAARRAELSSAKMAEAPKKSSHAFATMASVGKAALLGIGGALLAVGGISVKSGMDFQESMTQLVTGAGESESNIKLVSNGILHMAGQVGISSLNLSKGMYLVESAGYHGAQGLVVLKAAAEGARVGGADMTTVADGLTTALNDYHLPASQAALVTSQLVATVASGKTHMQDLAGALATVLPAASSAHIGLAQVLGAMATMTANGTPAADAATYLKQTIAQLSNPTAKAAGEMKALGLSSIDISSNLGKRGLTGTMNMLTTAIASHMGPAGTVLIQTLQKASHSSKGFQTALAKLPPTQQTYIGALADMVGGTKSMQAALELTGSNAKTFNANVKTIGGTTTEAGGHVKGFALTQKDLATQVANAKAAAGALAIQIGMRLIPVISATIREVTKVVGWFEKHKAITIVLASVIGGVLVAAIGAYTVSMAAGAVASLAAMAPMILIVGAVGLVIAGVVLLATHWKTVWTGIKAVIEVVWRSTIKPVFEALKSAALTLWHALGAAWHGIDKVIQFVGHHIVQIIRIILAVGLGPLGIAIDLLWTHWKTVWGGIKAALNAAWGFMRPILQAVVTVGLAVIHAGITALQTVWDTAWNAIKSLVQTVWGVLGPIFTSIVGGGLSLITTAVNALRSAWDTVWNDIKTVVQGVWSAISPIFSSISSAISGIMSGVGKVAGIAGGIGKAIGGVGKFLGLASGGPVSAGQAYVVGEQGPELFVSGTAGTILPHSAYKSAMHTSVAPLPAASRGAGASAGRGGGPVTQITHAPNITVVGGGRLSPEAEQQTRRLLEEDRQEFVRTLVQAGGLN